MPDIGKHIRTARKNSGLTQKQLAGLLGAKHGSVSNWEKGRCKPETNRVSKIAECLGVTVTFLFYGTDTDPNGQKKIALKSEGLKKLDTAIVAEKWRKNNERIHNRKRNGKAFRSILAGGI